MAVAAAGGTRLPGRPPAQGGALGNKWLSGVMVLALSGCSALSDSEIGRVKAAFDAYDLLHKALNADEDLALVETLAKKKAQYQSQAEADMVYYGEIHAVIGLAEKIYVRRIALKAMGVVEKWEVGEDKEMVKLQNAWARKYGEIVGRTAQIMNKSPADAAALMNAGIPDTAARDLFLDFACQISPTQPKTFCVSLGRAATADATASGPATP